MFEEKVVAVDSRGIDACTYLQSPVDCSGLVTIRLTAPEIDPWRLFANDFDRAIDAASIEDEVFQFG